jgi:hypothetical protein
MLWFLECLSYFIVDDFILVFVIFVELLELVDVFFVVYGYFWLFVLKC